MGRNTIRWDNIGQMDLEGVSSLLGKTSDTMGRFVLDALKQSSETTEKRATEEGRRQLLASIGGVENSRQAQVLGSEALTNAPKWADTNALFENLTQAQENVDASNLNTSNIALNDVRTDLFGKEVEHFDANAKADRNRLNAAAEADRVQAAISQNALDRLSQQDQAARLQMQFFDRYRDPLDRVHAFLSPEYQEMVLKSGLPVDLFTKTAIGQEIEGMRTKLAEGSSEKLTSMLDFHNNMSMQRFKEFNFDRNTGRAYQVGTGEPRDSTIDSNVPALVAAFKSAGWSQEQAEDFVNDNEDTLKGLLSRNNNSNLWYWIAKNKSKTEDDRFSPNAFIGAMEGHLADLIQNSTNEYQRLTRISESGLVGSAFNQLTEGQGTSPTPAEAAKKVAEDAAKAKEDAQATMLDEAANPAARKEAAVTVLDDSLLEMRNRIENLAGDMELPELVRYLRNAERGKSNNVGFAGTAVTPYTPQTDQVESFISHLTKAQDTSKPLPYRLEAAKAAKELEPKITRTLTATFEDFVRTSKTQASEIAKVVQAIADSKPKD